MRLDVGALGVQRGVDGAVGVVQEERLGRVGGLDLADHPHGAVGEVVGEVVAVGVLVGVDDASCPRTCGGGGGSWSALRGSRSTGRTRAAAARSACRRLRTGRRSCTGATCRRRGSSSRWRGTSRPSTAGARELAGVAGEPGVDVGHLPHADGVGVAARQQRGPRRRAQRGDVEVGVAQPGAATRRCSGWGSRSRSSRDRRTRGRRPPSPRRSGPARGLADGMATREWTTQRCDRHARQNPRTHRLPRDRGSPRPGSLLRDSRHLIPQGRVGMSEGYLRDQGSKSSKILNFPGKRSINRGCG